MSKRGVVMSEEYNEEVIMACKCGHYCLAHHFSKEGCAVEDCECEKYQAVTDLPGRKELTDGKAD